MDYGEEENASAPSNIDLPREDTRLDAKKRSGRSPRAPGGVSGRRSGRIQRRGTCGLPMPTLVQLRSEVTPAGEEDSRASGAQANRSRRACRPHSACLRVRCTQCCPWRWPLPFLVARKSWRARKEKVERRGGSELTRPAEKGGSCSGDFGCSPQQKSNPPLFALLLGRSTAQPNPADGGARVADPPFASPRP